MTQTYLYAIQTCSSNVSILSLSDGSNELVTLESDSYGSLPYWSFPSGPGSKNAYTVRQQGDYTFHIYEVDLEERGSFEEGDAADYKLISKIAYVNDPWVGFHLMPEERYGVLVNSLETIVVFEFDPEARWDQTTGSNNEKQSLVLSEFAEKGPRDGIASYYFNRADRSMIVISRDQRAV